MIVVLISTLLGLMTEVSAHDADALRSTAPDYLTVETAAQHLGAARVAGLVTGTDPTLLLSIAWHESRYDHRARTAEPGGKISCGVMTPVPMTPSACRDTSLVASYVLGAQHLRGWLSASQDLHTALIGYAGGYVGIAFCRDARNARDYRCGTSWVFLDRARRIRHAISRASVGTS